MSCGRLSSNLSYLLQIMLLAELFILHCTVFSAISRATHFGQNERAALYNQGPVVPNAYKSAYVQFSPLTPNNSPVRNRLNRIKRGNEGHLRQQVCNSTSRWMMKSTAVDIWGNRVNVLRTIDIRGVRLHQYFYETYCQRENCECRGINTRHYNSKCESRLIWAYAKVANRFGTKGWNIIKLRGSCTCSITERADDTQHSIWDD